MGDPCRSCSELWQLNQVPVTKKWIQEALGHVVQENTHYINYYLHPISIHRLDNNTAIAFLNRMGGIHSPLLSRLHDCRDLILVDWKELEYSCPGLSRKCASRVSHGTGQTSATGNSIEICCCSWLALSQSATCLLAELPLYCIWKSIQAALTVDSTTCSAEKSERAWYVYHQQIPMKQNIHTQCFVPMIFALVS